MSNVIVLCIGLLLGSVTKPPKVINKVQVDTLRTRDTIKVKDSTDWTFNDSLRNKVEQSGFEMDLKALNVICIKRTFDDGNFCTYIMYKDKDGNLHDHQFTCSERKHNQLIRQFKRQIGDF